MSATLPMRARWLPILAVLLGAPICAEFLQAYLSFTGDLLVTLLALLIFAPLYGGAALLIREVAVRRGLGWSGILLLAAAYGLAMPGLVDLALFGEDFPGLSYWVEMRQATLIPPLGISAFPMVSWVAGHVLMSIAAPLAILAALAPRHRGRPLLGRWGIVVTTLFFLLAVAAIRSDAVNIYENQPSLLQSIVVTAAVAALLLLSLTPLGKPVTPHPRGAIRWRWSLVLAGALGMFVFEALPWTWVGVAFAVALLAGAGITTRYLATTRSWSVHEIGALAAGALIGRAMIGFLAPAAEGVTLTAKLTQNVILLSATLVVAWLVVRRGRREADTLPGHALPAGPGGWPGTRPDHSAQ